MSDEVSILRSFVAVDGVITELCMLWPNSSVVRGTPRHSEPNGGIKRRNLTFETRLGAMVLNEYFTKHWSVMVKLVVWCMNTCLHCGIKNIPYKLVLHYLIVVL